MIIPEGTAIGSIVVGAKLAGDSSGDLYRGRQPGLDRKILIRVLDRDHLDDPVAVERFRREAWLASRISHPNVVAVYDYFSLREDHYLVLELVDGPGLRSLLEETGPLPAPIAARLALEISRGLAEMHARGVIHAGVQPGHVLISRWGEVKLRGLGAGREMGEELPPIPLEPTPYAAPELIRGDPPSPAADVFGLGALLHELLSGRPPGEARDLPAGVDRGLARLAGRCLSPDPARRPRLTDLIAELERVIPEPASPDCRTEIATWLWEIRTLQPGEAPTRRPATPQEPIAVKPTSKPASAGRRRTPSPALAFAMVIALALVAGWGVQRQVFSGPNGVELEQEQTPPVSASAAELPASVVFTAYPWAEVQVDDRAPFLTPRAEPLSLAAGAHEIRFVHPRFGEARRSIVLRAGERRVVRHSFTLGKTP